LTAKATLTASTAPSAAHKGSASMASHALSD